jgi:hypothetical protein
MCARLVGAASAAAFSVKWPVPSLMKRCGLPPAPARKLAPESQTIRSRSPSPSRSPNCAPADEYAVVRPRAALSSVKKRIGVERVGEQEIGPAVAVDVAARDALGVREVHAQARHALVGEDARARLDELVDHEHVLALEPRRREALAVGEDEVEVAVQVDVDRLDALAPARRARDRARLELELLGLDGQRTQERQGGAAQDRPQEGGLGHDRAGDPGDPGAGSVGGDG